MSRQDSLAQLAVKDEHSAHPVAAAWRATLADVVRAFVRADYGLVTPIANVEAIPTAQAERIRAYFAAYRATLIELPSDAWKTSCAQWMDGYWDVIVDLWTKEEGRSDLVLAVRATESDGKVSFKVQHVYVP